MSNTGLVTSQRKTDEVLRQAKARALASINDPKPRLTALERAYWVALRKQRRQTINTKAS